MQPDIDLFGPDWTVERERALAKQYIAKIELARGGKGRWSPPIGTRVAITWAGHDEPDATLAERVERLRADAAAVAA